MQPNTSFSFDADTLSDTEGFWAGPRENREGLFTQLRATDELFFSNERGLEFDGEVLIPPGPGFWSLVRHDQVAASKQPSLFCSGKGSNIADLPPQMLEFFGSMINMDDPRHARLRRIVSRGFTPRMLEQLNDAIVTQARDVIDGVADKGSVDFVHEVSARLIARFGHTASMRFAVVTFTIASLLFGFTTVVAIAVMASMIQGLSDPAWNVVTNTVRQRLVPDEVFGRMMTAYLFISWSMNPVGALAGGIIAERVVAS